VAELVAALGLRRVVLGGLSMGGYVAFAFCRRHAELLNGLILSATRPDSDSDETKANRARLAELARRAGSSAVAEEVLPGLLAATTRDQRPEVVDALRAMMTAQTPEAIASALSAMSDRADSRSLLPEIRLPVLVTGGTEDSLTPPGQIEEWAAEIPGAHLAFIPAAGHVANLERPDDFNALVTEFLGTVYTEGGKQRGRL
jgi:pimeloyl-ACP methyl ester carboxylesterase